MRALKAPSDRVSDVLDKCISSIRDTDLRKRLSLVSSDIDAAEADYDHKGTCKVLYSISQQSCDDGQAVLGAVTKKELKDVYSLHMVPNGKPAREFYEKLLFGAPRGRCPLCGHGQASTLDHYLPKSRYPQLAVVPLNLVPCCKDCNTGKGEGSPATAEQQTLHPYFDHDQFVSEQWLYANVVETRPPSLRFFVSAPEHWDDTSKKRVHAHFQDFNLSARYSIEASNELACLRYLLADYRENSGAEGVRRHLEVRAHAYANFHLNSWQTAMFQALAANEWYCEEGFS